MPQVKNPTRSQFDIIIKFAQNFESRILCDFVIRPYIFKFEVYDYFKKEFVSNICPILTSKEITQKLHFRVFVLYPIKMKGKINYTFPDSIEIIKMEPELNNSFDINGDFTFSMEINMQNDNHDLNNKCKISLEIENDIETIKFYFVDPNSAKINPDIEEEYEENKYYYLSIYPCYSYRSSDQKWTKIRNEKEMNNSISPDYPYIITIPFKYYSNFNSFTELQYNSNDFVNATSTDKYPINYIQVSTEIEDMINISNTAQRTIDKKKNISHYSIIGYLTNDTEKWFPVFSQYPNESYEPLPYETNKANIDIANKNINLMFKYLRVDFHDMVKYLSSNNPILPVKQTNSSILLTILLKREIILNINTIINCMPKSIRNQFNNILDEIQPLIEQKEKLDNELVLIISHNLIIKFMQVFSDRYNDIYRHKFCLQNPLISSEISKQIQVSLDEFMKFDSDKAKNRNYTIKSLFDSKEKELSDIEIEPIPEELNTFDCVLISENDVPKPCRKSDRLGDISSFEFEEEEEYVAFESDLIQLPTIKIPDDKSIKSLISFYSTCAKGASVLPTYIGNCIINSESVKKSEKYFTKLLRIYKTVTKSSTSNKSILSNSMNDFIESFKNCVNRLKYAGANFKKILPKNKFENSQNIRVFIWIPEADPPVLPHIPWKTKDQILNPIKKYTNDTFIDLGKLHIEDISEFSDDSSDQELQIIDSSQSKIPEPNPKTPIKFSDEEKNFLLSKFVQDLSLDDNSEINNNIANENKNDDDGDIINEFGFHIEPEFSQIQYSDISSEKFELISDNIKKIDNIQFILNRISKMDKNDQLELTDVINNSNYLIPNQEKLFETSIKDFPVKSLVDKTKYLVTKLIASASNCNCPFLSMSCNLLIDCSKFISNDFKIHNFMLLTAFSYALSALEIPFTISLVADQNFRFLLKSYNESISLKILQRVFDCLFIKRYRVNIADTFNYAINLLKHKERDKRAIFIFTNGLDENLILTKSWGKLILNDSNNSFGLIFLKPKILDDSKYKTIINMWDEFGKIKFVSKTKLIHIKKNLNDKIMSKVINLFADVLSHPIDSNNEIEQIQGDLKPEFVKSYDEFGEDMYLNIEKIINYKFDEHQIPIFRKINQIPKIPGTRYNKLDVHFYRNKIAKMATTQVNQLIKNKFDLFIHKNFYLERSLYRQQLEVVFKPNKASQVVLSSTGTDIDITALILNLINPVPNPLIYLEEKGGLIRNYGVSIVIDSSNSCFNQFSCIHSYQTIKVLLSGLGSIDIPFTDVIISTNDKPQILSTEIPSKRLFNQKSPFWPSLFSSLLNKSSSTNKLESAIHAALDIRRMRSVNSTGIMFVLTDGLFQNDQKYLIQKNVLSCIQNGITIIGIGIGPYPIGINDMFPYVVFSPNPNYIFHGIASFFNDESGILFDDSIKVVLPKKIESKDMKNALSELEENIENPIFESLKKYLSKIVVGMDAVSHVYNKEFSSKKSYNVLTNPDDVGSEMYVENLFNGQKILVVMPYDSSMNLQENPKLLPENLFKSEVSGESCVQKAIEYYGITIKCVQNYKDAIKELTKQTDDGKCDYYAVWILSGLPYDVPLADGENQHLVMEFIHCAIEFWEKGGSVVLFAEGDPLTFQANLFLEEVRFPGNVKTKLRLSGVHKGKKILTPDLTGKLKEPGKFNKHPNEYEKFHRAPLGHNLVQIYEGETISFAPEKKKLYDPFVPFMRDSDGGIIALFYPGDRDQNEKRGDIIVDCGYSKLFDAMTKEGTFKYVQNIAAWTMQYESRQLSIENPEKFRPDAISFKLNESAKFNKFVPTPDAFAANRSIDTSILSNRIFAIDYSGSIQGFTLYHQELRKIFDTYYKEGDVILIWCHYYKQISKEIMDKIINNLDGNGYNTEPYLIAQFLAKNKQIPREHLILVTDGCVDSGSIEKSDKILTENNIQFKYVTTYVIGHEGDLSVGAPFARGCGSKTIEIKNNSRIEIIGANESDFSSLEKIEQINDIDSFNDLFNSLFNATKQKMIGTKGDEELTRHFEMMNELFNQEKLLLIILEKSKL